MKMGSCLSWPFKVISLILILGVSMIAVAGMLGSGGNKWKEEVLLHDGATMIVERSQSYVVQSELGQSAPIREHSISFTPPGSNKLVAWTSGYQEELGRMNLNLLAVHVLKGTSYVVASPNLCLSYNKWGRPNPPYVLFKYREGAWQRISLNDFPIEFTTINVALSIQKFQAEELTKIGLISAMKIKELNQPPEIPEFASILRAELPKAYINEMCEERVNYRGYWILPNDNVARKIIDQKTP